MKSFRFPLQRVLDWRGIQLRTEEEKLAGLQQKLAALMDRENDMAASGAKAESALLHLPLFDGSDLSALAGFKLRIKRESAILKTHRAQCQAHIAEQLKRLLKARKDCHVLEQLKEKRLKAWMYLGNREVEETAAESYISNWLRSNTEA
jgi:flagellar export protein FliJ